MAIAEIAEYAHLSAADVETLAVELDAIRLDIEDSRGANDSPSEAAANHTRPNQTPMD